MEFFASLTPFVKFKFVVSLVDLFYDLSVILYIAPTLVCIVSSVLCWYLVVGVLFVFALSSSDFQHLS